MDRSGAPPQDLIEPLGSGGWIKRGASRAQVAPLFRSLRRHGIATLAPGRPFVSAERRLFGTLPAPLHVLHPHASLHPRPAHPGAARTKRLLLDLLVRARWDPSGTASHPTRPPWPPRVLTDGKTRGDGTASAGSNSTRRHKRWGRERVLERV